MSTQEESVKVFKPSQFFITAMIIKNKKQKTNKKNPNKQQKKDHHDFCHHSNGYFLL